MTNQRAVVACVITLLLSASLSAQTTFKLTPVVSANAIAPVPHQLGSLLEFSSNQQGKLAAIGDGGLFVSSAAGIRVITALGRPAPGGGMFLSEEAPIMDGAGNVVFRGNVSPPSTSGLFTFSGSHLTQTIADGTLASNGQAVIPRALAINASGNILLEDVYDNALYLFSQGLLTPLVAAGQAAPGGDTFSLFVGASMNDAGQVVFDAYLSGGGGGIYLYSGGTIKKIIATSDVFPDGATFELPLASPSINKSGQIAFSGVSNGYDSGLFLYSSGTLQLLLTPGFVAGAYINEPDTVSLNDSGQIAFTALMLEPTVSNGVFLYSQGQVTGIEMVGQTAPDGGVFNNSTEVGAQINATGQVVFLATEEQRGNTLYRFSQGQLTELVGQGRIIPVSPRFTFPVAAAIGRENTVLVSDVTFPGGTGVFTAQANAGIRRMANIGQPYGRDGVLDFIFDFAMNRNRQVAVTATASTSFNMLLLGSQNGLNVIADNSSSVLSGDYVAVNNQGEVAFTGYLPDTGHSGLFLDSAGQFTFLVDAATPLPAGGTLNFIENPVMSNQHEVAFLAEFSSPSPNGIYLSSAGELTALARDGDPAPGGGNFSIPFGNARFGPVMNDKGQVAFATWLTGLSGGFLGSGGLFLLNNGSVLKVVGPGDPSPDGGTFLFADSPSINASGQVAFFGETSLYNFGAFLYAGGAITEIALAGEFAGTQQLAFVDMPLINDNGSVGLTVTLLNGKNAIYVAQSIGRNSATAALPAGTQGGRPPFSSEQMRRIRSTNSCILAHNPRAQDGRKSIQTDRLGQKKVLMDHIDCATQKSERARSHGH